MHRLLSLANLVDYTAGAGRRCFDPGCGMMKLIVVVLAGGRREPLSEPGEAFWREWQAAR